MSCAPFDLRDYVFDALEAPDRRMVAEHVSKCDACGSELERLRLTVAGLKALPDQEVPRRIAFVSDRVFQPSAVQRWWEAFSASGARVLSASAALLALAILVHPFLAAQRAVIRVVQAPAVAAFSGAPTDQAMNARIDRAVDAAVSKAVAASDARSNAQLAKLTQENTRQRAIIERAAETIQAMDAHARVWTIADNRPPDHSESAQ